MKDTLGRNNRSLANKQCGACGSTFRPIRATSRFCSRSCMWSKNGGRNKKSESWWQNGNGYIEGKIWLPDGTQIRVKQHRFVVEGILGRALLSDEDIHHKNGIKNDNRPENLEVIKHGAHTKHTNLNREYARGYKMKLTAEERKARSMRAIAQCLATIGRKEITKTKEPQL